jgi:hypothetical protein
VHPAAPARTVEPPTRRKTVLTVRPWKHPQAALLTLTGVHAGTGRCKTCTHTCAPHVHRLLACAHSMYAHSSQKTNITLSHDIAASTTTRPWHVLTISSTHETGRNSTHHLSKPDARNTDRVQRASLHACMQLLSAIHTPWSALPLATRPSAPTKPAKLPSTQVSALTHSLTHLLMHCLTRIPAFAHTPGVSVEQTHSLGCN